MGAKDETVALYRANSPQAVILPDETGRPVWAMALLVYAAMLPREIRFEFGSLIIYPDRAVLYALVPLLLFAIARGGLKFRPIDFAAIGAAIWMIIAISAVYDLSAGIERGGALAFDFLLAYLVGRVSIGSARDFQRLLVLVAPGFAIAGIFMLMESVTHRLIVKPIAVQMFGPLPLYLEGDVVGARNFTTEVRLGLLRGQAGFNHAIQGGTFLCSALSVFLFSRLKPLPRYTGIVGSLLGFFSVSSTALLVLVLTISLSVYEILQRKVRELSWKVFALGFTALILFLEIFSKSGAVSVVIRYFTLSPGTGYFRTLIWRYGSDSVARHPWVGIGFQGYERPVWMLTDSVDSQWLLAAIRFGLPAAILLGIVFLGALVAIARASAKAQASDRMILRSIAFFLACVVVAGFTVSFAGSIFAFFTAMAGIAVTLSGAYNRNSPARA